MTTLFVTADFGILMQDSFPLEAPLEALLGLQVNKLQCIRSLEHDLGSSPLAQVTRLHFFFLQVTELFISAQAILRTHVFFSRSQSFWIRLQLLSFFSGCTPLALTPVAPSRLHRIYSCDVIEPAIPRQGMQLFFFSSGVPFGVFFFFEVARATRASSPSPPPPPPQPPNRSVEVLTLLEPPNPSLH